MPNNTILELNRFILKPCQSPFFSCGNQGFNDYECFSVSLYEYPCSRIEFLINPKGLYSR